MRKINTTAKNNPFSNYDSNKGDANISEPA